MAWYVTVLADALAVPANHWGLAFMVTVNTCKAVNYATSAMTATLAASAHLSVAHYTLAFRIRQPDVQYVHYSNHALFAGDRIVTNTTLKGNQCEVTQCLKHHA
jgi:hypothetical protein